MPLNAYIWLMESVLPFLLGVAMLATLGVLVVGIVSFALNGPFYQKNSNKLMRLRVLGQGIAVAIMGLIVLIAAN